MKKILWVTGLVAAVAVSLLVTRANARTASAAGASLDDATIVAIFDAANTADIETGALGAERAQNKEVRDYGTMLAQVHVQVRKAGRDLAKKLNVTPTPPKNDQGARDHQAAMEKLRGLSGAEFDRAFLQHEQAFHAAVLSALKTTLIPAIQNKELKDFVVSLGPAFEAHRLAAENLQKRISAN
jgi:putative membrane protein